MVFSIPCPFCHNDVRLCSGLQSISVAGENLPKYLKMLQKTCSVFHLCRPAFMPCFEIISSKWDTHVSEMTFIFLKFKSFYVAYFEYCSVMVFTIRIIACNQNVICNTKFGNYLQISFIFPWNMFPAGAGQKDILVYPYR